MRVIQNLIMTCKSDSIFCGDRLICSMLHNDYCEGDGICHEIQDLQKLFDTWFQQSSELWTAIQYKWNSISTTTTVCILHGVMLSRITQYPLSRKLIDSNILGSTSVGIWAIKLNLLGMSCCHVFRNSSNGLIFNGTVIFPVQYCCDIKYAKSKHA